MTTLRALSKVNELDILIVELARLPGVDATQAERIGDYILRLPADEAMAFAVAIRNVKRVNTSCMGCGDITVQQPCKGCCSRVEFGR